MAKLFCWRFTRELSDRSDPFSIYDVIAFWASDAIMTDALSQVRRLPDSRVDVAVDLGDFSSLHGNKTMLHVGGGAIKGVQSKHRRCLTSSVVLVNRR